MSNTAAPTAFQVILTDLTGAPVVTIRMTSSGFWHLYDTDFSGPVIGYISLTGDHSGFQAQQNSDQRPKAFAICQFKDAVTWIWQGMKNRPARSR